jgi:hypothetical protein
MTFVYLVKETYVQELLTYHELMGESIGYKLLAFHYFWSGTAIFF